MKAMAQAAAGLRALGQNKNRMFCADKKLDEVMYSLLGPVVCGYLAAPSTQELLANFEPETCLCRLFIDDGGGQMRLLDATLEPNTIVTVTRMLATLDGQSLDPAAPFLSITLAGGFRWHSVLPPSADGASVSIRVHPRLIRGLGHFMTEAQQEFVKAAIARRETIVISGTTSSGKTTLANAVINLMPADERLLVIEDTPELQIRPGNVTRRRTTGPADLARHVREALRDRPSRIIIGEVRGAEAADILEAASTGHPSLSTIHAGNIPEALTRLQRLARCDRALVTEAIDLAIQLERQPDGSRSVTDIRKVDADT
jgi:type IV secretion system protein TrbB